MGKNDVRRPAGHITTDEAKRSTLNALAVEHLVCALDHLFKARKLAMQAAPVLHLNGKPDKSRMIAGLCEQLWRAGMVNATQAGLIKPGDTGKTAGIPPEDSAKPGEAPEARDMGDPESTSAGRPADGEAPDEE